MQDSDCVEFLQWALPRLHRRWPGFRKVRAQVCKRIDRRCKALGLAGPRAYRDYLEQHPAEWEPLDRLCPITISTFYRDKAVFDFLGTALLPHLAQDSQRLTARDLRALSIGCASGEEPYTLRLVWHFHVAPVIAKYRCLSLLPTFYRNYLSARARPAIPRAVSSRCPKRGAPKPLRPWRADTVCARNTVRGSSSYNRMCARRCRMRILI